MEVSAIYLDMSLYIEILGKTSEYFRILWMTVLRGVGRIYLGVSLYTGILGKASAEIP